MIKEANYYNLDKIAEFKPIPNRNNNNYNNKNNMRNMAQLIPNNNIIEDYDPLMNKNKVNNSINNTNTNYITNNANNANNNYEISMKTNYSNNNNNNTNNNNNNNNNNNREKEIKKDKNKEKEKDKEKSIWRVYSEKMIIIHNDYILSKVLGKGSFGIVHQGFHKDTYEPVAIKLEDKYAKTRILAKEYHAYTQIYEPDSGLPKILAFGEKDDYQYIVMQMLGKSLEELLKIYNVFSLKTVLMLADQLIERMRFMHKKGYIHRDIKPENFLMGIQESSDIVHVIDLGLSKKWKLPNNHHIKYLTGNKIIGTARYASINSHIGNQLSRRDDMESLGYLLVYLAKGKLPWQNLRSQTKEEKYLQISQKKQDLSIEKLCTGLPKEFILYFKHVKSLDFEEEPCYDYLKGLFLTAFSDRKYTFDFKWDWST